MKNVQDVLEKVIFKNINTFKVEDVLNVEVLATIHHLNLKKNRMFTNNGKRCASH